MAKLKYDYFPTSSQSDVLILKKIPQSQRQRKLSKQYIKLNYISKTGPLWFVLHVSDCLQKAHKEALRLPSQ